MNANKQDAGGEVTNPDNVGGLPLLFSSGEWLHVPTGYRCDSTELDAAAFNAFQAYGELCRAAPAGGECQHEWQPDADVMNARYCPKCDVTQTIPRKPNVSAPAGSGEVDDAEALREFTEYFVKNYPGPHTVIMDPNWHAPKIFRAAKRALLRKLQQGADYSFRVLEVGEVILEHDEYVNDYGQWAKVKPPFLGMAYMLNMRTVRRAASQGQEGV